MVDKIDMSLDEIIKSNEKSRGRVTLLRGHRTDVAGGRGSLLGRRANNTDGSGILKGRSHPAIQKSKYTRGDVNSAWKYNLHDGPKRSLKISPKRSLKNIGTSKLLVSNLDFTVSDTDMQELFSDFGPLKSAAVHYDRSGRSLGTADVVFERRSDAAKAMKQYNGVPLDGRPMNIQFATSEVPSVKSSRVQQRNANSVKRIGTTGKARRDGINRGRKIIRGGGGRGGGRGGRNNRTAPQPTADVLDAELDAYVNGMK